jgi:Glyoxalase-like domain
MSNRLDHLVIAAHSLEQGVAWCEATLGITPGPGGVHTSMGTHNRLARLDGTGFPDSYLEIIAIDPAATPPSRPRWFGLDDAALQARLAMRPRLLTAVVRTPLIEMHRWGLINVGLHPGEPIAFERASPAGPLAWRLLVRDDGTLLHHGALPTLIEWKGDRHPAAAMAPSGLLLQSLRLAGVPKRAQEVLKLRGIEVAADAEGPAIRATFTTPLGSVSLQSDDE